MLPMEDDGGLGASLILARPKPTAKKPPLLVKMASPRRTTSLPLPARPIFSNNALMPVAPRDSIHTVAKEQGIKGAVAHARSMILARRNGGVTRGSQAARTLMPVAPAPFTESNAVQAAAANGAATTAASGGGGGGGAPVASDYPTTDVLQPQPEAPSSSRAGSGVLVLVALGGLLFLAPKLLKGSRKVRRNPPRRRRR